MVAKTFLALSLLPTAFAHFKLNWPTARGSEEGTADQFPCGGYNNVQQQRTDWPITGGPLQLNMGHPQTNLAVYMAVGNNPGSGFSVKLRPQFVVEVLGDFCVGQLTIPSGINVSDGTPASIQVVSNAHSNGGLYQCTDVTLRSATLSQSDYDSHCKNNTGARVTQENMSGNPNGTSSTSPSGSASGSGAASSPTSKPNAASQAKAVSWVLGAVGVAGLALL